MYSRAPYVLFVASVIALSGCDHRPAESALYGTWVRYPAYSESLYYEFRPDGTLNVLDHDGKATHIKGKWYAGGPNIYLRFPSEVLEDRQLVVWHIVDISPNEFRVRAWRKGEVFIYQRVNLTSPKSSNQSMKPTAPPRNEFSVFGTTPCRGLSLSR